MLYPSILSTVYASGYDPASPAPSRCADVHGLVGGIMKCDVIAQGIVNAAEGLKLQVPLVVRLEGTNVERGKEILKSSGMDIITADDLDDAASKAVKSIPH